MDSDRRPVSPALPIVVTVVWLIFMAVVSVIGLFSFMVFDSGTDVSVWTWLVFLGIWGSVLLCPASIVASWVAWGLTRSREGGRAVRTAAYLLPLLGVLIFAVGLAGTEVACGGSLTC